MYRFPFPRGVPEGPFVALGHRKGMKIHLEPPKPPPDPLALGASIEQGARGILALDIGLRPGFCQPVVSQAKGKAWTFASGKV